jgi:hypothetical protein
VIGAHPGLMAVTLGIAAIVVVATSCSDDVASPTATSTATAQTSAGQGGSSSQTGSGQGGLGSGGATVGQGGAPPGCQSCNQYLQGCDHHVMSCPPERELCPSSATLFGEMQSCLCEPDHCGTNCELTCTGQGNDGAQCETCLDNFAAILCQGAVGACSADT